MHLLNFKQNIKLLNNSGNYLNFSLFSSLFGIDYSLLQLGKLETKREKKIVTIWTTMKRTMSFP